MTAAVQERAARTGPPVTVQGLLERAFRRHGDRPCFYWDGGEASYRETFRRCSTLATWLQHETDPGAHIAILLENSRECLEAILACALAGRVRVPLNAREAARDQAYKIDRARSAIVITTAEWWEEVRPHLSNVPDVLLVDGPAFEQLLSDSSRTRRPLKRVDPGARYRLSFTGGTTGTPKAVVQTDRQELAMIRNLLLEVTPMDETAVFLAATPLSHASGAFIVPTVLRGGALAWLAKFDADAVADPRFIPDDRALVTFLVPTALSDLCAVGSVRPGLRVVYGGAPCPLRTFEDAVNTFDGNLVQVYGQAEAPMTICVLPESYHRQDSDYAEGCVGFPFLWVEILVCVEGKPQPAGEVGEVEVVAENVMDEDWDEPEATSEKIVDGRLRTSDLGYFDDVGKLWLVGRSRELIISGGYNVHPIDVERRLGTLRGAHSYAVFGVPHPRWGEAVVLAVVRATPEITEAELDGQIYEAAAALADYERPKRVLFVDDLPLSPIGKVSRGELTERYSQLFTSQGDQ